EAGLIVENEALGAYFEEVFAWDWKDDLTAPVADAGPDRTVRVGTAVTFSGLGSWDDAAVTNYSWDLDGDGTFDMWGAEVTHRYTATGTFTVRLVVADAWNNTAEDTAIVVVTRPPAPPTVSWPLVLAMLVAAGFASFALVRRRRKGTNRPP
ncbi:MAG: PKD domain-containing protein, partial [Euryarchaeota archaeon]|nr:PKD domain-containing protein [Euryarchaeota archaeon]